MCVASAKLSRATVDPMDWTSICVATLSSLCRMTFPTTRGDVFSSLGPTRAIVPLTDFKINKSWSLSYNPQQQQRQSLSGRARVNSSSSPALSQACLQRLNFTDIVKIQSPQGSGFVKWLSEGTATQRGRARAAVWRANKSRREGEKCSLRWAQMLKLENTENINPLRTKWML